MHHAVKCVVVFGCDVAIALLADRILHQSSRVVKGTFRVIPIVHPRLNIVFGTGGERNDKGQIRFGGERRSVVVRRASSVLLAPFSPFLLLLAEEGQAKHALPGRKGGFDRGIGLVDGHGQDAGRQPTCAGLQMSCEILEIGSLGQCAHDGDAANESERCGGCCGVFRSLPSRAFSGWEGMFVLLMAATFGDG